jgi:hypothetical protein
VAAAAGAGYCSCGTDAVSAVVLSLALQWRNQLLQLLLCNPLYDMSLIAVHKQYMYTQQHAIGCCVLTYTHCAVSTVS